MAPTAARRAKWVQRNHSQGLQGNPDACRPRRGSARDVTANRAGGNARPVFALSVQPTAAMNPRIGGPGWAEPPGPFFPTAFFGKESGAPAESEAPGALPIKIQRSHLQKSGPLREGGILYERATTGRPCGRRAESSRPTEPAVAEANGRMISAPTGHGDFHASLAFTRRAPRWIGRKIQTNCKLWRAAVPEAALSHCFLGRGGVKYHGLGMTWRPPQAADDTEGGQTL